MRRLLLLLSLAVFFASLSTCHATSTRTEEKSQRRLKPAAGEDAKTDGRISSEDVTTLNDGASEERAMPRIPASIAKAFKKTKLYIKTNYKRFRMWINEMVVKGFTKMAEKGVTVEKFQDNLQALSMGGPQWSIPPGSRKAVEMYQKFCLENAAYVKLAKPPKPLKT